MKEIWKDISGYEGLYKVSNFGRVKSLQKNHRWGVIYREKIIYGEKNKQGYIRNILTKNKKNKKFLASRLVAMAFIKNPKYKKQVNHINGIKSDNRVLNLEWCTPSENVIHAYKSGLHPILSGENCKLSHLKNKDAFKIRELSKKISVNELSKKFKVSYSVISSIINNKTYRGLK